MAYRVAGGLFHEHLYYPWDVPWIVRRSLDAIRPRAFAVLETEIWPLMLDELRERGIPAILVNGRFSDRTAGNIRSHLSFWRRVYKSFSLLLVRSERDRELLLEIGLEERRVQVTGDCKIDAILLREEEADLGWARAVVGETGPVFLAGSTHPGEEEIVLEAFQRLKAKIPSARLIVAPRHPQRSTRVLELAKRAAPAALLSEVEREKKGKEGRGDGKGWENNNTPAGAERGEGEGKGKGEREEEREERAKKRGRKKRERRKKGGRGAGKEGEKREERGGGSDEGARKE